MGAEVQLHTILSSALDGGERLTPCDDRFTPGVKHRPIPIEWEVTWAPGTVRTFLEATKFLTSIGVLNPDPPARTESLNPLSYPGPGT